MVQGLMALPGVAAAQRKPARDEAKLHRRCVKLLMARIPGAITYRGCGGIHLGGGGGGEAARAKQLARHKLLKLEGSMAGVPDLLVLEPGADGTHAIGFEFKTADGRVEHSQALMAGRFIAKGYAYAVIKTEDEFIQALEQHLGLPVQQELAEPATVRGHGKRRRLDAPKVR